GGQAAEAEDPRALLGGDRTAHLRQQREEVLERAADAAERPVFGGGKPCLLPEREPPVVPGAAQTFDDAFDFRHALAQRLEEAETDRLVVILAVLAHLPRQLRVEV